MTEGPRVGLSLRGPTLGPTRKGTAVVARNPYVSIDMSYPIKSCDVPPTQPAMPPLPPKWSATMTMPAELDVFVPGQPKTQGSKNYKGRRKNGSAILVESADVKPWRYAVAQACRETGVRFAGPVEVHLLFVVRRPQRINDAMTGLGRSAGDGDKLERAVWDALTEAGVIEDDSRVLRWSGAKVLAAPGGSTGVRVKVRSLT